MQENRRIALLERVPPEMLEALITRGAAAIGADMRAEPDHTGQRR